MDLKKEKQLLAEYPLHIYLMVKAAKQALDEGRATIKDGVIIFQTQKDESPPREILEPPGEVLLPPNRP